MANGNIEPSTADAIAAERTKILKRIDKLNRQIQQLKTRHNALSPINRIPPELLVRIFFVLQTDFEQVTPQEYYNWTVVTHVSNHWRSVALETKQLWNVISYGTGSTPSPWVAVSLERSHPVHHHIAIKFDLIGDDIAFLSTLADRANHIRTVYITVRGRNGQNQGILESLLDCLTKHEFPVLERLCIKPFRRHRFTWNTPRLTLFKALAPHLKILRVQDFDLKLQSIPFAGITHLDLEYQPGDQGVITFPALFNFLRITRLSSLRLFHALPLANLTMSGHSHTRYTPQSFFDTILPRLCPDPSDILGLGICVADTYISFRPRKREHIFGDKASFVISIVYPVTCFSKEELALPLPSLSRFSNIWIVWMWKGDSRPTVMSSPNLVEAITPKIMELPSLRHLVLWIHFHLPIAEYLYQNPTSEVALTTLRIMKVSMENCSWLDERLERALEGLKSVRGQPLANLALCGNREWVEKGQNVDVVNRLRKVAGTLLITKD